MKFLWEVFDVSKLVEIMREKKNYHGLAPVAKDPIDNAQEKLGLSFSSDYEEYISSVGVASFGGHELTGICSSPRLNVVSVTEKGRLSNPGINSMWYVLEELNIDQITIWQDGDGNIYRVSPHSQPVKIAKDITDYINS